MKTIRLSVAVLLFAAGMAQASAQTPIRLQLEIAKNDTTLAKPEVSVPSGVEGNVSVDGVGTLRFTPTLRGSDSVVIAFSITSAGKQLQPRLVLRDKPGTISWTSDTGVDSFDLRVSWFR